MNLFMWLMTGVLVAWAATCLRSMLSWQRLLIEVLFAVLGAVLGGLLAAPARHWLSAQTHWPALAAALLGAVLMLGVCNLRSYRSGLPD